ncbi:hypothetical protein SteCoe_27066 [Stentor coeruleus]|uniref:Membrane transporter protein n=1 Tax=Stentor coeruleus TaxID=5963 RepID=A0A1R2BBA3_9CILI|nr:hypothetical protein SteCoe_27066 [Stentor coeruleus]
MLKWVLVLCIISNACKVNEDCHRLHECISNECVHKTLTPITFYDIIGAFCVLSVSSIANASGLGGGSLMTIIMITIFNFSVAHGVALSQITVFAGTLLGTLMRLHLRHPTRDRPAIDYEFLLIIIAPLLFGTTLGVLLSMMTPPWLILSILTIILIWVTFEAAIASVRAYSLENRENNLVPKEPESSDEQLNITYVTSDRIAKPLKRIIKGEQLCAPPVIGIVLSLIYVYNVIILLMRGSYYFMSIIDIDFCSVEYWVLTGSTAGFSLLLAMIIAFYLNHRTREKINVGYNFDDYDMIWSFWPCLICVFSAIIAGVLSGLLSVGGGLLMSPIMLKLGLRPQVVIPTSSVLHVLTSSLALIIYIISGRVEYYYAIWVSGAALIGSMLGILGIKFMVNKYKRASIMIITMTFLFALCAVIIPAYGIIEYATSSTKEITSSYCPNEII